MQTLQIDSEKVIAIVYHAGQTLKKSFGNIDHSHFKTNTATGGVTRLDEETEKFIAKELNVLDTTIGFKGEEFGEKNHKERFWLLDPLDGTAFFARGIPGCTTMLALIENNEITFSVIYDFILDNMYYAKKGDGAFLNKHRISVSNRNLKGGFIYVEMNLEHDENIDNYIALQKSTHVLGKYPAGIHFAYVADGKVEGRICQDPIGKDYDFAPGQLLVKEAGGVVANLGTHGFEYQNLNFLAVNQEVYNELTSGDNPIFPISTKLQSK